jgi:hypothetical protein
MPLFARITLAVAAVLVLFIVLVALLKIVFIAALIAAVAVGVIALRNALTRRRSGGIVVVTNRR